MQTWEQQMKNFKSRNAKTFVFLISFFVMGSVSYAQDWLWTSAGQIKSESKFSNGVSFVNDAEGNFIVTGYFAAKAVGFGEITIANTDASGQTREAFVAKFTKSGKIIWANSAGGPADDAGNAVCVDQPGNVYVAGDFRSIEFSIGDRKFINTDPKGYESDIFVAKYDRNGNLLWAKSAGGSKNDRATGISADASGNVSVSGTLLSRSADFDKVIFSNPDPVNSTMAIDYVAEYDNDGHIISVIEKDKELKKLRKAWADVFQRCLLLNKIKISCAGCPSVRFAIKISVNSEGKIVDVMVVEDRMGLGKLTASFKKCLLEYLFAYDFPAVLRNQIIELRVDRTLKC
jgi:hypothetical protein